MKLFYVYLLKCKEQCCRLLSTVASLVGRTYTSKLSLLVKLAIDIIICKYNSVVLYNQFNEEFRLKSKIICI